jgi:hypothetical protein
MFTKKLMDLGSNPSISTNEHYTWSQAWWISECGRTLPETV